MSFYICITRCFVLHLCPALAYCCARSDPTFLQGSDKKTNHEGLFYWIEYPVNSLASLGLVKMISVDDAKYRTGELGYQRYD